MPADNELFAKETDAPVLPEDSAAEAQTNKYLICISDGLFYGVDAEKVETIITGQITPIIDIRLRLGKPQADESCIMVFNEGSDCMGILVDGVDKMVEISRDSILPMPTQNPQKLISGMCSLPDGETLLILDCALLLHE